MISRNLYQEDLALKRLITTPKDQKPRFQWGENETEDLYDNGPLKVKVRGEQRDFDLQEIADTIGNALTDLMLARQQDDIFNDENRRQVKLFSMLVSQELNQRARQSAEQFGDQMVQLSAHEVYQSIERVLIRNNAHDVARSVMARRQYF